MLGLVATRIEVIVIDQRHDVVGALDQERYTWCVLQKEREIVI
jgi:hypothetical protein